MARRKCPPQHYSKTFGIGHIGTSTSLLTPSSVQNIVADCQFLQRGSGTPPPPPTP